MSRHRNQVSLPYPAVEIENAAPAAALKILTAAYPLVVAAAAAAAVAADDEDSAPVLSKTNPSPPLLDLPGHTT